MKKIEIIMSKAKEIDSPFSLSLDGTSSPDEFNKNLDDKIN